MSDWIDLCAEIAAHWEHGHDELVDDCSLCLAEWAEVWRLTHGSSDPTA